MDLRVRCGPRVTEQEGKRKVVAAEGGAATRCRVGDRAGFEEPVQLHTRPAAQLNVGYQPALLRDVNRQDAHGRHRGITFGPSGGGVPAGGALTPLLIGTRYTAATAVGLDAVVVEAFIIAGAPTV